MNKHFGIGLLLVLNVCIYAMEDTKNAIIWNSEKYRTSSSPQRDTAMRIISDIEFDENCYILDIGCGPGFMANELAKKVPRGRVVGVDTSENMIKSASQNYNTIKNLCFMNQDMSANPLTVAYEFDYVFSFASFAWIKNQEKLLKNIAAVLKKGTGKFIAGIAHEDSLYLKIRRDYIMNTEKWRQYFVNYEIPFYPLNENKMKQLCDKAGLDIIKNEKGNNPAYFFKERQDFIKFMKALPAQIDKIPTNCIEGFLNDIIDEYIKVEPVQNDGAIKLVISGLSVIAQKK